MKRPLAVKPRPLQQGDVVALAAPAGFCEAERVDSGSQVLEDWGLVVEGLPSMEPLRYFAGDDRARAQALAAAFSRSDLAAVLCVRGGYGCSRLFDHLSLADLVENPKIFVGYSDVTLLLDRMVREHGVACFHGPMVASDLTRFDGDQRERFRRFLFGLDGWWDGRFEEVWTPGRGSGPLVGGCLSVLVTTLGTPFEIDTRGTVLFLEDVAERPYRIDRMLMHLRQAGKFDEIQGLVVGSFLDCYGSEGPGILRTILAEVLDGLSCPVVFGLDAGHGSGNVVLPLGCQVDLDTERQELLLLEDPFAR
jgi:muramoyltetrapeptide carboxypeptidase